MAIFYNAETRPNAPHRFCTDNKIVLPDDPWYKFRHENAYVDFDTMMSECDYAGSAYYWEDNYLHCVYMRQPFEFVAVSGNSSHDGGINWGTAYFCTKEEAETFWHKLHGQRDEIQYNAEYDVYSIHYHY